MCDVLKAQTSSHTQKELIQRPESVKKTHYFLKLLKINLKSQYVAINERESCFHARTYGKATNRASKRLWQKINVHVLAPVPIAPGPARQE